MVRSAGSPRAARHSLGGRGRKRSRSTPLRITCSLPGSAPRPGQLVHQGPADSDGALGPGGRPTDHAPRQDILGDEIDVGAAGGDHEGLAQPACQHGGRHPVRIVVVGIDQIEVVARRQQVGDGPACPQRHEERGQRSSPPAAGACNAGTRPEPPRAPRSWGWRPWRPNPRSANPRAETRAPGRPPGSPPPRS